MKGVVVGAGSMGRHHVRLLNAHPSVSSVIVCDPDRSALQRMHERYDVGTVASLGELLDRGADVDFAVLALPTPLHHDVAVRLVARGVHCLVEKPVTSTVAEARHLAEAAEKQGVIVAVGQVERYNPAVHALRELLRAGRLGEPKMVTARRSGPPPPSGRRAAVDVILDIGIHEIDVLHHLFEVAPRLVSAVGGCGGISESEDFAFLAVDYGDVTASIQVDWLTPYKVRRLEVIGTEGQAVLSYTTQDLRVHRRQEIGSVEDFTEFLLMSGREAPGSAIDVQPSEPLANEIDAFISAVRGERADVVSAREACASLAVVEDALRAIRSGSRS